MWGNGVVTHTYSDRGRRRTTTAGGATYSYLYNGLDQRVRKSGPTTVIPTGVHNYVYDESGQLLGEYDNNRALIQETVYLGTMSVAVLQRNTATQIVVNYVYADHIDTPRVIARASDSKIVWRWDQTDPFGMAQPLENPSSLGAFVYNPRFPGQLYDKESGLHYNYFRDYDPQTGRYVQSDPIGLEGGMNTYGYVGGNPVSQIDPLGLVCTTANGITTCNYPGGPSFKIPAGPGSPQQISGWNPLYHMYDVIQPLGQADLQCVLDKIRNNPTPGNPSPATTGGTANNAVVGGQPNWVTGACQ
ncbi:RHS repeat-associated core domain-containing protein [Massilia sp. PAMC28688]|nr:RHS repeat-associated core domain-containing protein [Massilia sp. PAMC28688]